MEDNDQYAELFGYPTSVPEGHWLHQVENDDGEAVSYAIPNGITAEQAGTELPDARYGALPWTPYEGKGVLLWVVPGRNWVHTQYTVESIRTAEGYY